MFDRYKKLTKSLGVLACMITAAAAQAGGIPMNVVVVDNRLTTGADDGTSWPNAFLDLQDALTEVEMNGLKDEIWIAVSVDPYLPITIPAGDPITPADRAVSFIIPDGVSIIGGFQGTESLRSQRSIDVFADTITVLNGDLDNNDNKNPAQGVENSINFTNHTNNSLHVVEVPDTSFNVIIRDLKITGGYADNPANPHGGGLDNDGTGTAVVNCIFFLNGSVGGGGGSAIHNFHGSLKVHACSFLRNDATGTPLAGEPGIGRGGAIWLSSESQDIRLVNCVFSGNSSDTDRGGHLFVVGFTQNTTATLVATNCTFAESRNGGAVYFQDATDANSTFRNCIFWNNEGADITGDIIASTDAQFRFCTFQDTLEPALNSEANTFGIDPRFVDANGADDVSGTDDDDPRVTPLSPVIDTGSESTLLVTSSDEFDAASHFFYLDCPMCPVEARIVK